MTTTSPNFSFLVISDLHLEQRAGVRHLAQFAEFLHNTPDTYEFVLITGDILWNGEIAALQELLNQIPIPVEILYGNHDYHQREAFGPIFGEADRVFEKHGCLFAVIWNALSRDERDHHRGDCSELQWEWLESELANAAEAAHRFVAGHVPPTCPNAMHPRFGLRDPATERLELICAEHNVSMMFFGHVHHDSVFRLGQTPVVVTPSLNWNFVRESDRVETNEQGFFRAVHVSGATITHNLFTLEDNS